MDLATENDEYERRDLNNNNNNNNNNKNKNNNNNNNNNNKNNNNNNKNKDNNKNKNNKDKEEVDEEILYLGGDNHNDEDEEEEIIEEEIVEEEHEDEAEEEGNNDNDEEDKVEDEKRDHEDIVQEGQEDKEKGKIGKVKQAGQEKDDKAEPNETDLTTLEAEAEDEEIEEEDEEIDESLTGTGTREPYIPSKDFSPTPAPVKIGTVPHAPYTAPPHSAAPVDPFPPTTATIADLAHQELANLMNIEPTVADVAVQDAEKGEETGSGEDNGIEISTFETSEDAVKETEILEPTGGLMKEIDEILDENENEENTLIDTATPIEEPVKETEILEPTGGLMKEIDEILDENENEENALIDTATPIEEPVKETEILEPTGGLMKEIDEILDENENDENTLIETATPTEEPTEKPTESTPKPIDPLVVSPSWTPPEIDSGHKLATRAPTVGLAPEPNIFSTPTGTTIEELTEDCNQYDPESASYLLCSNGVPTTDLSPVVLAVPVLILLCCCFFLCRCRKYCFGGRNHTPGTPSGGEYRTVSSTYGDAAFNSAFSAEYSDDDDDYDDDDLEDASYGKKVLEMKDLRNKKDDDSNLSLMEMNG